MLNEKDRKIILGIAHNMEELKKSVSDIDGRVKNIETEKIQKPPMPMNTPYNSSVNGFDQRDKFFMVKTRSNIGKHIVSGTFFTEQLQDNRMIEEKLNSLSYYLRTFLESIGAIDGEFVVKGRESQKNNG